MAKIKSTIPSNVRIKKNILYHVVYANVIENKSSTLGQCDTEIKQIQLSLKQSKTSMLKTFLHELLHAIDEENPGKKLTESQIRRLEEGIFRVLKLNGWI